MITKAKKSKRPMGSGEKDQLKKPKKHYSNNTDSQCLRILSHFETCPRLDRVEASELYSILHLAARILTLRKRGYQIDTHWKLVSDSNGVVHRIGVYVFRGRRVK